MTAVDLPRKRHAGISEHALSAFDSPQMHRVSIRRLLSRVAHRARAFRRRMELARQHPLAPAAITACLAGFGPPPRAVMVHGSLSACGFVKGGAAKVIRLLRQWAGPATLAMPTHTYSYPGADGTVEVFDPASSPSRVGAITDAFWRQAGVLRSLHPSHSLAAVGDGASALVAGHERCDTPCGSGTPYLKLVEQDAGVLMFGVSLNTYTLFHTAEDAAGVGYLYEPAPCVLKVREPGGCVRDFPMRRQDMKVVRRFAAMDVWLEARGLLQRRRCGRGEILWLPHVAAVHEAVTTALRAEPWLLVEPSARPVAPALQVVSPV